MNRVNEILNPTLLKYLCTLWLHVYLPLSFGAACAHTTNTQRTNNTRFILSKSLKHNTNKLSINYIRLYNNYRNSPKDWQDRCHSRYLWWGLWEVELARYDTERATGHKKVYYVIFSPNLEMLGPKP